jgi:hypothetical protein
MITVIKASFDKQTNEEAVVISAVARGSAVRLGTVLEV